MSGFVEDGLQAATNTLGFTRSAASGDMRLSRVAPVTAPRSACTAEASATLASTPGERNAECGDVPFAGVLIPDEFHVEVPLQTAVIEGLPQVNELPHFQLQTRPASFPANAVVWSDLTSASRAAAPDDQGLRRLHRSRDTHAKTHGDRSCGDELAGLARLLLKR